MRLLLVDAHRRARADEVSITVDVVHAADGGPELRFLDVREREGRRFARVGAVPVVGHDVLHRVRRVVERRVLELHGAVFHVLDFRSDR